jgi:hypothetical protein
VPKAGVVGDARRERRANKRNAVGDLSTPRVNKAAEPLEKGFSSSDESNPSLLAAKHQLKHHFDVKVSSGRFRLLVAIDRFPQAK